MEELVKTINANIDAFLADSQAQITKGNKSH